MSRGLAAVQPGATGCNRVQPGATGCKSCNRAQPVEASRVGAGSKPPARRVCAPAPPSRPFSAVCSYHMRRGMWPRAKHIITRAVHSLLQPNHAGAAIFMWSQQAARTSRANRQLPRGSAVRREGSQVASSLPALPQVVIGTEALRRLRRLRWRRVNARRSRTAVSEVIHAKPQHC